jgi:hypothetical protein
VPASLMISAADDFGHKATWNLSCMPAKGDVPDPAAACAAIAAQPNVVTNPDQGRFCLAPQHTWTFTIYGRVDNRWVLRSVPLSCRWDASFITKLGLISRLRSAARS